MKGFSVLLLLVGLLCSCMRYDHTEFTGPGTPEVLTYTHRGTNVHFVEWEGSYLMIDSGLPDDLPGLLSFMSCHTIDPLAIDYLILTHGHPDHAGNAAALQQTYGVRIIAGADELSIIERGGRDSLCPHGLIGRYVAETIGQQRYPPFVPDVLVTDSLDLDPFGWPANLKTFTSHTPGSLVLYFDQVAFVGDLIKGQNLRRTRPAYHLVMCDLGANIQDLEEVLEQEEATTWYLGHFGPLRREDVLEFVTKATIK